MRIVVPLAGLAALVAACGSGDRGDADDRGVAETRTVEITMADVAFAPDTVAVQRGETVRFLFSNEDGVAHDAFIGDAAAQVDHEQAMRAADEGHGGGHGDVHGPDGVTVEPGATAELTHTFDEPGTLEIGCHQPGHYDAGMTLDIDVSA